MDLLGWFCKTERCVPRVREGSGDQEVCTDLFNIFAGKSDLVLDIVFGGSVLLAKLAQEGKDPFRPLVWYQ